MALGEKRKTGDGGATNRVPALHPHESYLSPPRTAFRVPAAIGCSSALDLRAQRGRKPVRIISENFNERRNDHGYGSERKAKSESGVAGGVDCSTNRAIVQREGVHAAARRIEPAAAGIALGKSEEGIRI